MDSGSSAGCAMANRRDREFTGSIEAGKFGLVPFFDDRLWWASVFRNNAFRRPEILRGDVHCFAIKGWLFNPRDRRFGFVSDTLMCFLANKLKRWAAFEPDPLSLAIEMRWTSAHGPTGLQAANRDWAGGRLKVLVELESEWRLTVLTFPGRSSLYKKLFPSIERRQLRQSPDTGHTSFFFQPGLVAKSHLLQRPNSQLSIGSSPLGVYAAYIPDSQSFCFVPQRNAAESGCDERRTKEKSPNRQLQK